MLIFSIEVRAEVYPWVWLAKNDIQVTEDAKVEAEFRLYLMANAKESLDIVTYDQQIDETVGLPLLKALEDAAKRGVKIRFAVAWIAGVVNDFNRNTERFLRDLESRYPNFKYIPVGSQPMWMRGWGLLDGVHEKIFLVDNKISLVSGRGHAGDYLRWLDTGFLYKGAIVAQTKDAFEQMWQTIKIESVMQVKSEPLEQANSVLSTESPKPSASSGTSSFNLTLEEQQELDVLKAWADVPSSNDHDYQARSIYYNFLAQVRKEADRQGKNPRSLSYDERAKFLKDPYVDTVLALLPQTKRFQMNILATILLDNVSQSIIKELQRGMEMEIITNGYEAHSIFPTGPGWFAGIHTLDDLLQAGAVGHELKQNGPETGIYQHRKLLILDDHVFFGSHNFTKASTLVTDEYSIEILSQDFADKMRQLSSHSIEVNTVPFDADAVHKERLSTPVRQWFGSMFEILYMKRPKKQ